MAKKAAKRGAPQKTCPECGTTQHARKAACEKCGHLFAAKAPAPAKNKPGRKPGRPAAAATNGQADTVQTALAFIKASGGIDRAVANLSALASIAKR